MKRQYFLKTIIVLFISGSLIGPVSAWGQSAAGNDPHKTGLPELSSEELRIIETTHPKVKRVKINARGLERVNQARQKKNKPLLSPEAVVADGEDLVTAVEAVGGTVSVESEAPNSAFAVLPDSVDNSALKYFPPIRSQGSLGSCGSFSGVYYTMTYMLAKARDLDAKNGGDAMRLSPKWAYNMVNGGSDSGSWYYWAYSIGVKHGNATWAEFPYDSDYRAWSLNPDVWRASIERRFDRYGYVANTNTDEGINLVKEMLVNGYILNFPTYIYSWQTKTIGNDPAVIEDDPFVGKPICYWVNGSEGYHAMTVVGYNDHIWVDINANGTVDPGEKGAFRIANSWGTGWGEAGFMWMAYDALKNPSAVEGGPSTGRVLGWSPASAHWVLARAEYSPKLVGYFTLNHLKRNQLRVTLGVSDATRTAPTTVWYPSYALSYAGGPYAFNGTTTAVDGTFVFDFTDIVPANSGTYHFYLGMQDSTSGDPAFLKSFKLVNVANGGTEAYSSNASTSADAAQVYASVSYDLDTGNAAPVAVISALPVSGYAPLDVAFDGANSYDLDGSLVSYGWDFGDGVTAQGVSVRHTYVNPGTYTARLSVTDDVGGSASAGVTITVAQNPEVLLPPSGLKAALSGRTVTLTWLDGSTNESGFYIERGVKTRGVIKFQRVAETGADVTRFQETILTTGTYAYRVQAFNIETGMRSTYTNIVNVNIKK